MADDAIDFDIDDLSCGELEDIEDTIGEAQFDALMSGKVRPKALTAIAWIVRRRTDPEFTLEQARGLKLKLNAPDPTGAAAS